MLTLDLAWGAGGVAFSICDRDCVVRCAAGGSRARDLRVRDATSLALYRAHLCDCVDHGIFSGLKAFPI